MIAYTLLYRAYWKFENQYSLMFNSLNLAILSSLLCILRAVIYRRIEYIIIGVFQKIMNLLAKL